MLMMHLLIANVFSAIYLQTQAPTWLIAVAIHCSIVQLATEITLSDLKQPSFLYMHTVLHRLLSFHRLRII